MKNNWLKKIVPHLAAVVIFIVVSLLFCKPVLEGNELNQHDVIGWKGAAQNAYTVKEATGKMPLWNTSLFGGMPNYQIAMEGKSVLPDLSNLFGLGLPQPANFFMIACLCFYILGLSLGLRPVVAIMGALAYGFSTYNPVIIAAGHVTKMFAIGYMPLLLAGLVLIFSKKYWIGLSVAVLGTYLELYSNHPQINYYFFIIAAFITLFYGIRWVKEKDFKHLALALGLSAVAAVVGMGAYWFTYTYTKEYTEFTIRGGKSVEIQGDQVTAVQTKGLDEGYAFSYSMKMAEPLVMLMPGAYGGASSGAGAKVLGEDSKVIDKLTSQGVQAAAAMQMANLPAYWGGMSKPGEGTSGPPYIGAIICLLALIGFITVKHPARWGLLAASVLAIFMSWGSYFPGLNVFLLHNLPLYNKFRAPSMILVIPQLTLVVMAVITVNYLFFKSDGKNLLQQHFKKILYVLGGLIVFLGLVYLAQGYTPGLAEEILKANQLDKDATIYATILSGLKADRQAMFGQQILRTVLFACILLAVLYFFMKGILKPVTATVVLLVIAFTDLWIVDKKYLTDDYYVPKETSDAQNFVKTQADEQILQDKDPHYRVLDMVNGMNSNHASYYHRSVLGYHPAKLRIYQDIIEKYFSGQPPQSLLNALDTRYLIVPGQQGGAGVLPNPEAYGAAWFVKAVRPEADAAAELIAIGQTNLRDTAIIPQSAVAAIGTVSVDTAATLTLTKYTNDLIEYSSSSAVPQFAVFSEVYYPAGWTATIDGKEVRIVKTDYFMRGLAVPAGQHTIKFEFKPVSVLKAMNISYISSILIVILVLGGISLQLWNENRRTNKVMS